MNVRTRANGHPTSLAQVKTLIEGLGLSHVEDTEFKRLFVFFPTGENEASEIFCLLVVADYWLLAQSWPGPFRKYFEPVEEAASWYEKLLRLNDETRLARFFIDDEGFARLGADIRLEDLTSEALLNVFHSMVHILREVLPEAGPTVQRHLLS